MPPETRAPAGRLQRILAYLAIALVGLSVLAIIALLIIGGAGVKKLGSEWTVLYVFPLVALPLGALSIVALFVTGLVERRKLNSGQAK